ncbi:MULTISPECIES: hypothetical protein [unclassified Streptomyces]|uniref:hypothetical protein n=1 Tax=unclassified Streptomyces TaxID=2593676 RepID=UPI0009349D28|nr:hypothetical protein [Streptomyces sp. NBRC 110465]
MNHPTGLTDPTPLNRLAAVTPLVHPKLRSVVTAPRTAQHRPLDLRVRAQRIQIDELVVDDPHQVLAHARQAALDDPETARQLGFSDTEPLALPDAAALLCALYDTEALTDMGLRLTRHTVRVSASNQQTEPVSLVRSRMPEDGED